MDDHILEGFLSALKRNATEEEKNAKGLTVIPINYERCQIEILGDGKISLYNLARLTEYLNEYLRTSAHQLNVIFKYHPDSPRFWWDKKQAKEKEREYTLGLDLEHFIESKNQKKQKKTIEEFHYYIPDNYELAKKVFKEFEKEHKVSASKIRDNSFRETAMWESKNLKALNELGEFIQRKYVGPALKAIMKACKIETVSFGKDGATFSYRD